MLVIIRWQRRLPGRKHPGLQRRKRRQRKSQKLRVKHQKAASVLNKGDTGTEHWDSGDTIM